MFLQADHARRLKPRAVPSEAAGGRLVEAAQAAFAMRSPPVYGPGGWSLHHTRSCVVRWRNVLSIAH
jgi:hypothetical protein